ncbi:MAG: molecular chaperone TorD family protein [Eggerthellaceae bacterium]|nr:molecular chaperone TorD family protein [Eggerthellaceae bacterium]
MADYEREREIGMLLARRAYAYSLLHVVFGGEPDAETVVQMFGEQASASLPTFGRADRADRVACAARVDRADRGHSCSGSAGLDASDPALVETLRSDYARLFLVPGDAYVHPWESPYVGKESMLFQESTLDVRTFYHEAGFKLQAEKHFPDDHIAAMMDFMGRLSQSAYEAFADGDDAEAARVLGVQRSFAEKHLLTWVDAFAEKVAENDVHACYAAFAADMAAFVRLDCAQVESLAKELAAPQE